MAHLDVVPIAPGSEGAWTHAPFSGDSADGFVWGRGSLDLKVAVVCEMEAVESLIKLGVRPRRTIMLAFGHDEELGGENGNRRIAALLESRHQTFEFVVDEGGAITHGILPGIERPVAHVGVAEKGYLTLKLTAHGAGGHSSLPPPVGETAIGRLARALDRLEDDPMESHVDGVSRAFLEKLMPAMSFGPRLAIANLWLLEPVIARLMSMSPTVGALIRTTSAPTMIHGGIKENVLPSEASLTINFRIHERDTIKRVIDHVRAAIDDSQVDIAIMKGSLEPSPVTDVTGPQFDVIRATLEKVVPDVIVAPNLISGGTDARFYINLSKNIFRHMPVEVRSEDLLAFHGTNERVRISSVLQSANFFRELILAAEGPLPLTAPLR
jgi:carboxypeptidase PM20D1